MALGPQKPKSEQDKRQKKLDAEQDVFMREVDDAMREETLVDFWRRYGRWIAGLVVVGLAALGGYFFWQSQKMEAAGVRSEEFVTVLDAIDSGNLEGAANALEGLEEADERGYRAAALMMQANIALERGDAATAVDKFGQVAADESLPQLYRDVALIRQTTVQFDDLTPSEIVSRLKPYAAPGNPWFGSAGEMVALSYMAMEQPELAGALFAEISEDEQVPGTLRSRARQMAGVLGVDTIDDPEAVASGSEVRGDNPAGEGQE